LECKGQWAKNFVSKAVDENRDRLNVERVVQLGSVGTSGMVTDDLETFRLDNFEPEQYYPTQHYYPTQYSNPDICH